MPHSQGLSSNSYPETNQPSSSYDTNFFNILSIMDLEEMGINAGNWVDSAQDRNYWRAIVNAALNLRVP